MNLRITWRCFLYPHRWGAWQDGSYVSREFRVCQRCGHRRYKYSYY